MQRGEPPLSSAFWEKSLLKENAGNCIWHALVPTLMTTCIGPNIMESQATGDAKTEDVVIAIRLAHLCALCGYDLRNQQSPYVVRVLVAKRKVGGFFYQYLVYVNDAIICWQCYKKDESVPSPGLDSNSLMMHRVLDLLEDIARAFSMVPCQQNLDGPTAWGYILQRFNDAHGATIMKALGKITRTCLHCGAKNPRHRCSACNCIHYCGKKCSHADWESHKTECALYQKGRIFCYDKSANTVLFIKNP